MERTVAANQEMLEQISNELSQVMNVSSKLTTLQHYFKPLDTDDIAISSIEADGINLIIEETVEQIGGSILNAIGILDKLKEMEKAA